MRKLLLNPTPLFRKLRQLSLLLTLLLALPQTAMGETVTKTITLNKTVDETNFPEGQNLTLGSITLPVTITENGAPYNGQITIESASISSYSSNTNGAVFKMKGSNGSNSQFHLEVPGNYPAIPSQVTVETAYANASENGAYFSVELDGSLDPGNTHDYKSTSTSLPNTTVTFTADGNPRTNRSSEGTFDIWFTIGANWDLQTQTQTTVTVKEISITYTRDVYGITVAGTSVKSDNATDILGDGKVSYNATTNTLTLNGATINYTTGDAITASTTDPLNVNVIGTNSISCGDNKAFNTSGNLVFQTSGGVAPGQLTITSTSNINPQSYYTCGGTVTYENDLAATSNGANSVIISCLGYELYIDGTRVTPGNASDILTGANAGKVSYNAADNILTLNGASLSKIRTEISGLKINLVGTNTIVASDSAAIQRAIPNNNVSGSAITLSFNGTGNLTITKKLITGTNYYSSINNYITVSYNDGLVSEDGTSTTRISKGYNLTIAGTTVTELNSPDVFGDSKVSFTPASSGNNNTNTLTLNGVSFNNSIISNLDNLTILIQGDNDLANNQSGASGYISSTNTNAPLILKGGTGDCTLRLDDDYGNAVISGFASVTYDGVYLSTSRAAKYVTGTGAAIKDLDGGIVQLATITTTHYYPLWVNSIQVYEGIKDDIYRDGQNSDPIRATFAPASNTLTLNGVSIDSSNGIESGLNSLTINLKGNNSINTNTSAYYSPICSMEAVPLTIQKATDATNGELRLGSAFDVPQVVKGFSSVSHTGLNFASKTGSSITDAATKDAVLSSATIYPLWVRGTMVTGINKDHILGASDTSVTFDGTNTLTLNGADFSGMIESGLGNLTIHLTGTNKIQQSNNETNLITSSNSGVLTFETDATPGDLSFLNFGNPASVFSGTPFSGFSNIVYGTGIDYDDTNKKVCNISYPLTVAGTTVTSLNKNGVLGDNKVTFDPSSNTITLNGATINGSSGIVYNGTTDFTIALNGSNSIVNTTGNYAIVKTTTTNSLKFEKATNASTAELALKWATGDKAISANDSILGNGLYWKPIAATQMNITDNPEFVIVGDYAIPDGTPVNGATSGTITYNATDKLLTISSFSQTFAQDAIKTSVSGLKVKLVGASTITCNDNDGRAFTATTASASIQFVKNDADSKLTMNTTYDPLYNFATGAITYDGLYYYGVSINQYIIKPKNSPTIKFVVRDQTAGSIPASQSDYVYFPDNGIQIPYAASYYAPKPVFSDHYQLSDTTRYEYTMSVDGVVQFALGGTTQGNPGKIDYADDGKLNILKSGELTITCTFPGNLQNEPCSASYTLKITRDFNNPFAKKPAEQIYATYYNEYEDLSLPDGIVAYIVTGVSGNSVTTTATGYLPQNTAVLLEKTGNVGTTITGYTGSAGNFNGNLLKYTSANAVVNTTGKEYILYKNEFVKATGNISGSCYLDLSGTNLPARGVLGIGNDGSTAIEGIDVEATEDETWYDLQGRRIQKPTKAGIYIVNGKKVIINNK